LEKCQKTAGGDFLTHTVVFQILRSKVIGVTSLTFQGYVTSSVT